jgi:hypothetical protein
MLNYEVQESENQGEYIVSAIDPQNGGEVYLAMFSGPRAKERADEYAAWKNRAVDTPEAAPLSRYIVASVKRTV